MQEAMEGNHRARVQRFGSARTRTVVNRKYIDANMSRYWKNDKSRLRKARRKIFNCGSWLEFHHYYTKDEYRLVNAPLCKNRWLCSLCALRWADKALAAYYAKHCLVHAANPELIPVQFMLTVKPDQYLGRVYAKLEDSLRKVSNTMRQAKNRKRKGEFAKIKGMIGNVEIKKSSKQPDKWYPHFHGMGLLDDYIHKPSFDAEWFHKTGDSWITDLQEKKDPFQGFLETMSYSLKASTMSPEDQVEAFLRLQGKQTVRACGLYHGVQEPEPDVDTPLDDLPYLWLLYRYSHAACDYTLEDSQLVEK